MNKKTSDNQAKDNLLDLVTKMYEEERLLTKEQLDTFYSGLEEYTENLVTLGSDSVEVDYVECDVDTLNVSMSCSYHMEDEGIGPYEYWGCRSVHHDYQPNVGSDDFELDYPADKLAANGLSASVTYGDVDYGDYDSEYGNGTCSCTASITFSVEDDEKARRFVRSILDEAAEKAESGKNSAE